MAELITKVDDIDGTRDGVEEVSFSYRGQDYVIDLSAANQAAFEEDLSPYLEKARPVSGAVSAPRTRRKRRKPRKQGGPSTQEVRHWAQNQGYDVADHGRVPDWVYAAYDSVPVNPRATPGHPRPSQGDDSYRYVPERDLNPSDVDDLGPAQADTDEDDMAWDLPQRS